MCLVMLSFLIACDSSSGDPPHQHTYAGTWSHNDTHHWHAATCGHTEERKDQAAHRKESYSILEAATTEKPGKLSYACAVCQRTILEEIPKIAIEVSSAKPLATILSEMNLEHTTSLRLTRTLSNDDFKTLREMATLSSLDISGISNTVIPEAAFFQASFSAIRLPMGLTSIKEAAFCESNLTELIIPEGVTKIEDYLLLDAKKLTKLVIPSTIEQDAGSSGSPRPMSMAIRLLPHRFQTSRWCSVKGSRK